jgi:hypothetical protein
MPSRLARGLRPTRRAMVISSDSLSRRRTRGRKRADAWFHPRSCRRQALAKAQLFQSGGCIEGSIVHIPPLCIPRLPPRIPHLPLCRVRQNAGGWTPSPQDRNSQGREAKVERRGIGRHWATQSRSRPPRRWNATLSCDVSPPRTLRHPLRCPKTHLPRRIGEKHRRKSRNLTMPSLTGRKKCAIV